MFLRQHSARDSDISLSGQSLSIHEEEDVLTENVESTSQMQSEIQVPINASYEDHQKVESMQNLTTGEAKLIEKQQFQIYDHSEMLPNLSSGMAVLKLLNNSH